MNQAMVESPELRALILQRLEASAVTDAHGQSLSLGGPTQVVIGRVCDPEPLIQTERFCGWSQTDRIVRGLGALAMLCDAPRALLAVDAAERDLGRRLRAAAAGTRIEVLDLPARTPLADDDLVCDLAALEDKTLEQAGLLEARVVDAVVLCDVAAALEGHPPLRRVVTVAGSVSKPAVVRAPVGTTMLDLVQACGGPRSVVSPLGAVPYHNGALGGRPVAWDAAVDLDTRGVVVLPAGHPRVRRATDPGADLVRRVIAACTGCRICTDICPVHLNGGQLEPARVMRATVAAGIEALAATEQGPALCTLECVGCWTCSLSCPAGLDPSAVVGQVAAALSRRGVTLRDAAPLAPLADRAGRRLAVERATDRLGLTDLDAPLYRAPLAGKTVLPDQITLSLRSPSGGARVPAVAGGEAVAAGDVVALAAADSRDVDLRSPVAGTVHHVDPDDGVVIQPR
jgi:cobalamin reductase